MVNDSNYNSGIILTEGFAGVGFFGPVVLIRKCIKNLFFSVEANSFPGHKL